MLSLRVLVVVVTLVTVFAKSSVALNLDHVQNHSEEVPNDSEAADELDLLNYLQENRFKRRRFDKSDPRSLFAAVYSNYPYAKRFSEPSYYYPVEAAALRTQPFYGGNKRGLRSPLDPRNLFRAVYGYRK